MKGAANHFKFGKTVDKRIGLCVSSFYPVINLAVKLEYSWETCSFTRFSISCQVSKETCHKRAWITASYCISCLLQ